MWGSKSTWISEGRNKLPAVDESWLEVHDSLSPAGALVAEPLSPRPLNDRRTLASIFPRLSLKLREARASLFRRLPLLLLLHESFRGSIFQGAAPWGF